MDHKDVAELEPGDVILFSENRNMRKAEGGLRYDPHNPFKFVKWVAEKPIQGVVIKITKRKAALVVIISPDSEDHQKLTFVRPTRIERKIGRTRLPDLDGPEFTDRDLRFRERRQRREARAMEKQD